MPRRGMTLKGLRVLVDHWGRRSKNLHWTPLPMTSISSQASHHGHGRLTFVFFLLAHQSLCGRARRVAYPLVSDNFG